ncbi:hypothetical protein EOJ36_01680 [Sandaracinomonas limnophila]|uniref:Tetratricopeptide repeat protein n=1 Tax=Sandaracinomonas limnophila TaxID=1862386 RepID=A0A437PWV1_9BACT|nr:hypothetical protein [Sandaracinomonas limnophila]RVU26731.1 hypothetical protein EOJ36_01680 [Sandaracinomonas limnophila]
MEKAKQLWFLLNKIDRNKPEVFQEFTIDKEEYPFFYLLNWNEQPTDEIKRKVALQSLNRFQLRKSLQDSYKIEFSKEEANEIAIPKVNQSELIDLFLENLPVISKLKKNEIVIEEPEIDLAKQNFDFPVSETFAKILLKQGKFELALEVFKQLSLKFPEKKVYFADLIEQVEQKINK